MRISRSSLEERGWRYMKVLYDGLLLYHGSYCEVSHPKLEKCSKHKDFGQGFYLTSSREQAESFLRTSIIKAVNRGDADIKQDYGFLSVYTVEAPESLGYRLFEDADTEWLHCIAAHRKKGFFPELECAMAGYDVIIGKIANDQTNMTLTAYLAGTFGPVGDETADRFCISQLIPQRLKDQYCFRTEEALRHLRFVKGERVWLRK